MSQLLVDDIVDKDGGNSVGFSKGINVSASSTITGNLNVTGVLTYEDVTNVDSVGVITAQGGIKIGAAGVGGTIAANGDTTIAGVITAAQGIRVTGGTVGIKNDTSGFNDGGDDLVIGNGEVNTHTGMTLYSNSSDNGSIFFSDSVTSSVVGLIQYRHSDKALRFNVEGTERLRINASGDLNVTGISTVAGNLHVGSAITCYASSGIVSATSFHGDGSNLSNVSAGGWIPIANNTVTSGTTLCDFSNCFDDTYDHYRIEFTCHFGAVGNATVDSLRMQQYDSGSLRTSSDYDYSVNYSGNGTGNRSHATSSGGDSYAPIAGLQDSQAWQGHIDVWNPDLAVIQTAFNFQMNGYWIKQPDASANNNRLGVNGVFSACPSDNTPVAVTGFKIYSNGGQSFSNGNVVVYGLKTS